MKRILLFIFIVSLFGSSLKAQINVDTPNLSFDDGSLNGWSLYLGNYYYDNTSSSYIYNWTQKTQAQANNRIKVIGNISGTNDPIVACSGFYTNPFNQLVARIGEPLKVEGNGTKYAAAERLEYTFKVTTNTTLLSYKLAAVLKVPALDNHTGEQRPTYAINITVTDDNGVSYILPCSSYSSKADNGNTSLTPNSTNCPSSIAPVPGDYVYQKWLSGNIDLSNQIGKTVTISVLNHDCLLNSSGNIIAGNHDAYGYFWAQTSKIELSTFSCENSDATIYAPQGFTTYNWTRSDAKPITIPDPTRPYIASIDKSLNLEGIVYSCEMNDANSACGSITVSSTIKTAKLHPDFTNVAIDAGKIQFTDASTAEGDTITNYYWDFGDGSYSSLKNPIHTYTDFIPFNVKLTVTSQKGCTKTNSHNVLPTKELIATITPPANLVYNGQTKDFTATTNIAGLQMNIDYYIHYTNKPGTQSYNSYTAPSTAGDYNATFELSYLSLLKYYMTATPSQDFTIAKAPLKVTVDNVTKTYGDQITLLREAFTQDVKPLYAGDKIYELDLSCKGLADTASVGSYSITSNKAIGLGVDNYDITFVPGTLTVNQKSITIGAIDNAKTYGNAINITGREFYITLKTLIGNDTVTSVTLQCNGFDKLADVGTYAIKPSDALGVRLNNYKITYTDASLIVNKKNITVTAKALSKVYGNNYSFTGKEFDTDFTQFVGNDSIAQVQLASLATPVKTPVGEYNLSITGIIGNRLNNYDIKQINNKFTVIPMDITVIPKDQEKEYGDILTFSGHEFTTNVPMISGDTISFVSLKSSGYIETAPIGQYDIIASLAYGAGVTNYNLSYSLGKLKVIKKKLTATIYPPAYLGYNAQTKDFSTNVSVSGLLLNADYYIRYTNKPGTAAYNSLTAPTAAGDYTATFELSSGSLLKYYTINTIATDFTITKVPLTITADDVSKTYGDNLTLIKTAFKSDIKPLFGNDKIYEVELACNGVADTASVGNYPITPNKVSGIGMENYDINFVQGNLTVSPKSLQLKALDATKTYGSLYTPSGSEFYVDNHVFVGNDTVSSVKLTSVGYNTTTTVGTYPIAISNATGRRLNNYQISYSGANIQIVKKKITVAAKSLNKTYGSEYTFSGKEFETDFSQFAGSDSLTSLALTSPATAKKASVGDYSISITGVNGSGLDNYDIKLINSTFRIAPMSITVRANSMSKEYGALLTFNGNEFSTDKPLVSGDTISFVMLKSSGCDQNAPISDYDIFASQAYGAGTMNYDFIYQSGKLTVVRKKLTAAIFPPAFLGYNAQNKEFSATLSVSGLIQNTHYFIRYTNHNGTAAYNSLIAPTTVGDYTATFELSSQSEQKYSIDAPPSKDFTITKALLTITADDVTKTYGDNLNLIKTAFKSDMKPLFGNDYISQLDLACKGLVDTASVGTYTIIPVSVSAGSGTENYDINFVAGKLTVNPKPLQLKAVDATKTYGSLYTPSGSEFYVDNHAFVGNDTVSSVKLTSVGYNTTTTVGTYPIAISNATGRRLNNYQISYSGANIQIVKKKITVAAKYLNKTYGSEYTFSGKEFETDFSQFASNDSLTSLALTSPATAKKASVGDYSISITGVNGSGLDNYDIKLVNSTFRIAPMSITVRANSMSKEYGALLTFNGNEFSTDKPLVSGDTISFVMLKSTGSDQNAPISDYDIFASQAYGAGTMNYDFTYQSGKLTVVRKKLTAAIFPPAFLGYNAQKKDFSATLSISGLIQNTHYFIRYTNRNGTAAYNSLIAPSTVGDYTATFELSNQAEQNYSVDAPPSKDFTITKALLTITADNASKTYGYKANLLKKAFKQDLKPLYGSDQIFEVEMSCNGLIDTASVGTYSILPLKATGNGIDNYDIQYQAGTLTVGPKALLIKALDASKIYGDTVPNGIGFYVDAQSLVGNDKVATVKFTSDGYNALATVGMYSIKASNAVGIRLNNYQITYSDATLLVVKKKITVTAKALSKVYGSEYVFRGDEFETDLTQLVGNDKINSVKLNSQASQKKATVGQYNLSITDVSGFRVDNYDIKMVSNLFEVTPMPVIVTAKNVEKEYSDVLTFAGNEFTTNIPLLNGDSISYVFMHSAGSAETSAIGEYDIIPSQSFGSGSMNYKISYINGKLKVIQKPLKVTALNCVKEYGENDPELRFSVVDKRGVEYQPSLFSGKVTRQPIEKVGTYPITQGTLSIAPTYSFTFTEGQLTIKKALPVIDPYFTNAGGQFIKSDVSGTPNGDAPQGNMKVIISQSNIEKSISVLNGKGTCQVSALPSQMVVAELQYLGDDNYLPTTKSLNIYAIIYETNGGSLTSPITNFDGSESVALETPSHHLNYKFNGWYETPDFSGDPLKRIPIGITHDVHLYAKWSVTYEDLNIVPLFNQVLAVANPLNRDFIYKSTYKWYRNGVQLESNKQYCGFDNYIPSGQYRVEIYYLNNPAIVLELNHQATIPMSKVYPNPLSKNADLTLSTELVKDDGVTVEVFNSIGVKQPVVKIQRQEDCFKLNGFVQPGMYIVRVMQNGKVKETHKVIVEE